MKLLILLLFAAVALSADEGNAKFQNLTVDTTETVSSGASIQNRRASSTSVQQMQWCLVSGACDPTAVGGWTIGTDGSNRMVIQAGQGSSLLDVLHIEAIGNLTIPGYINAGSYKLGGSVIIDGTQNVSVLGTISSGGLISTTNGFSSIAGYKIGTATVIDSFQDAAFVNLNTTGTNTFSGLTVASGTVTALCLDSSNILRAGNCGYLLTYPGAGVAVSTGAAWGASLVAPAGALVGDTDAQTLTNKTVDGVTPAVFGFLDATSSIQTQLNARTTGSGTSGVLPVFTGATALGNSSLSDNGSSLVSTTEAFSANHTITGNTTGLENYGVTLIAQQSAVGADGPRLEFSRPLSGSGSRCNPTDFKNWSLGLGSGTGATDLAIYEDADLTCGYGTKRFSIAAGGNITTTGNVNGASPTEISYLSGVTSGLQAQLNLLAPKASPTFTGTVTTAGLTTTGTVTMALGSGSGGSPVCIAGSVLYAGSGCVPASGGYISAATYCTGSPTDYAPCLTTALAAASGKALWIPSGTYPLSSYLSIPANTTVFGDGPQTLLKRNASIGAHGLLDVYFANGVRISNLAIDGQVTTPTGMDYATVKTTYSGDPTSSVFVSESSIFAHGASNLTIDHLVISHTGGEAIYLECSFGNCDNITLQGNLFQDCRPFLFGDATNQTYGAWPGGVLYSSGSSYRLRNLRVEGNTWERVAGHGFWGFSHASIGSGGIGLLNEDVALLDNHFSDMGLDAALPSAINGYVEAGNYAKRVGYVSTTDGANGTPKWFNSVGTYYTSIPAVAFDTASIVINGVRTGNTIIELNGGCFDSDGWTYGAIIGNRCSVPESGDPDYSDAQPSSWGPAYNGSPSASNGITGSGQNWMYGVNVGNTNQTVIGASDLLVEGNTFHGLGGGSIKLYAARDTLVKGNLISAPSTIWYNPIMIGNTGTATQQRANNVEVTGNKITYSGSGVAAVSEDASYGSFTSTQVNRVHDNYLVGNLSAFSKNANSGSINYGAETVTSSGVTVSEYNLCNSSSSSSTVNCMHQQLEQQSGHALWRWYTGYTGSGSLVETLDDTGAMTLANTLSVTNGLSASVISIGSGASSVSGSLGVAGSMSMGGGSVVNESGSLNYGQSFQIQETNSAVSDGPHVSWAKALASGGTQVWNAGIDHGTNVGTFSISESPLLAFGALDRISIAPGGAVTVLQTLGVNGAITASAGLATCGTCSISVGSGGISTTGTIGGSSGSVSGAWSAGSLSAGSGGISTTGAISAGTSLSGAGGSVSGAWSAGSLSAGSGGISTTGAISAGTTVTASNYFNSTNGLYVNGFQVISNWSGSPSLNTPYGIQSPSGISATGFNIYGGLYNGGTAVNLQITNTCGSLTAPCYKVGSSVFQYADFRGGILTSLHN